MSHAGVVQTTFFMMTNARGTGNPRWKITHEYVNGTLMSMRSISYMSAYSSKSVEELRAEDYAAHQPPENDMSSPPTEDDEPDYESECKRLKTLVEQLHAKLTNEEDLTEGFNSLISVLGNTYAYQASLREKLYNTIQNDLRTSNRRKLHRYREALAETFNFAYEIQPGVWVPVTDPQCIEKLATLVTDSQTTTVSYTIDSTEYCATIDAARAVSATSHTINNIVQENQTHPAHTKRVIRRSKNNAPGKPTFEVPKKKPIDWKLRLLTGSPLSVFSHCAFSNALKEYCFDSASEQIVHQSHNIQYLATLFSSFSHKYEYDLSKCELWVKPFALQTFLRVALTRKYTNARLVMHGSTDYDSLRKDSYSFDIKYSSATNRYGPGIYCGLTNDVPNHYNKSSGLPDGSGVLGVVLFPDTPSYGHSVQYSIIRMSGKNAQGELLKDCCVVRDPMCFLALGLAVAKPRASSRGNASS